MGFGLWENLDPNAPKKIRRPKPPPPPPKAEPIWYNCTVSDDEVSLQPSDRSKVRLQASDWSKVSLQASDRSIIML